MKGIKKECQLMEWCDGHGVCVRGWRGMMVVRKCDTVLKMFFTWL